MRRAFAVSWGVVALAGATAFGETAMPKIVAHRGESAIRPENTLAAFRQSVAAGVWGMECDVYATTDGVQGVEPDGVYEVAGEWTFTAAPQTVGDTELVPKGYVLETWADGAWTRTASGSGAAYTYRAAETAGPVRLTWKFSSNNGTLLLVR